MIACVFISMAFASLVQAKPQTFLGNPVEGESLKEGENEECESASTNSSWGKILRRRRSANACKRKKKCKWNKETKECSVAEWEYLKIMRTNGEEMDADIPYKFNVETSDVGNLYKEDNQFRLKKFKTTKFTLKPKENSLNLKPHIDLVNLLKDNPEVSIIRVNNLGERQDDLDTKTKKYQFTLIPKNTLIPIKTINCNNGDNTIMLDKNAPFKLIYKCDNQ